MGLISRVSSRTYRKQRQKLLFRKMIQKLWNWPRSSAKTRFDSICPMAKIRQTPEATTSSSTTIEGSSINQPVQPDFGQTERHPSFQIGRKIRSRIQSR